MIASIPDLWRPAFSIMQFSDREFTNQAGKIAKLSSNNCVSVFLMISSNLKPAKPFTPGKKHDKMAWKYPIMITAGRLARPGSAYG